MLDIFGELANRSREPVRNFFPKKLDKVFIVFVLAGFILPLAPMDKAVAADPPRETKEITKINSQWKDKLVFERKKDKIFFESASDNLKKALANAPLEKLKITCYMTCRCSGSLHALGRAVDIGTRGLSRAQLRSLVEYLYSLPQAEQLLTGQMPQYNMLDGKRYFGKKYNARHKTHVHYGVKQ
ncbi:MAG: hypothetical protein HY813_01510 [Candidatus Portnoybacteria bacterium]|nr:hypothetical protein [Candidatus Portnoybacteria bacterium]